MIDKTQVQFQLCTQKAKLGTPVAGTIVFIEDTNELYLDGVYYGLSTTDAAKLAKAVTDISSLNGSVSGLTTISNSLLTYVKNLRKFADGADANSTEGPVLTTREGILKGKTNVKDAIDALADVVDRLNVKQWTAVTKPGDAGQFATSVEQGIDGSITVSYADVKSTDVKRDDNQNDITGATVEEALVTLKGQAAAAQAKANANETAIGVINGKEDQTGSIANAVKVAKEELIGTGANAWVGDEAKTLTHLRELIKANANTIGTLSNADAETLKKLTAIVNELKTAGENGDFAGTLLDKFLTLYGTPTDGKYNVNNGTKTTLQEIITAIENEISDGDTAVTNAITTEINKLDATVRGQLTTNDALEAGKHVGVKVVETDGKLTGVTVVENDIASAQALTNLTSTVNNLSNKVESQGSQLTWKVIS